VLDTLSSRGFCSRRRSSSPIPSSREAAAAWTVMTIVPSAMALRNLRLRDWIRRATMATTKIRPTNASLNVAHASDVAMTSMMNPISSGSLIGVRNRTMESAPRRPSESGSEN
jgi:hypothetical protein